MASQVCHPIPRLTLVFAIRETWKDKDNDLHSDYIIEGELRIGWRVARPAIPREDEEEPFSRFYVAGWWVAEYDPRTQSSNSCCVGVAERLRVKIYKDEANVQSGASMLKREMEKLFKSYIW